MHSLAFREPPQLQSFQACHTRDGHVRLAIVERRIEINANALESEALGLVDRQCPGELARRGSVNSPCQDKRHLKPRGLNRPIRVLQRLCYRWNEDAFWQDEPAVPRWRKRNYGPPAGRNLSGTWQRDATGVSLLLRHEGDDHAWDCQSCPPPQDPAHLSNR